MIETTRTEGQRAFLRGRAALLAALALVAVALGGCGSSPPAGAEGQPQTEQGQAPEPTPPPPAEEEPEVTVGYDDEDWLSRLGGELYARAMEENGFDATLEEGAIGRDVVMSYSDSTEPVEDTESGGVMLAPAAGVEERYVMSTSPEKAEVEGLADVADLLEIEDPDISTNEYITGDPREEGPLVEFYKRHPATEGQSSFSYLPGTLSDNNDPSNAYDAFKGSPHPDADAVLGWNSDGEIEAQDLVVLEDSQGILPQEVYYPAPVVQEEVLEEHPEAREVLDRLSSALATGDVRALAARVEVEGEDPEAAVAEYYGENLASEVSR